MSRKIVVMKTGTTISSLRAEGKDFEDWFIEGSGQGSKFFHCCAIDQGQSLPDVKDVSAVIITGSPVYVSDLASWNYTAATLHRTRSGQFAPMACQ